MASLDDYAKVLERLGKTFEEPIGSKEVVRYNYREQSEKERFADEFYYKCAEEHMMKFITSLRVADSCTDLPKKPGVYFLFKAQGAFKDLLYIGSSTNLRNRWGSHTFRGVLGRSDYFLYWKPVNYDCFVNHLNEEAYYISFLQPLLNVVVSKVKLRRFPGDSEYGPPQELVESCCNLVLSQVYVKPSVGGLLEPELMEFL